jgi:hypothetical protein
VTISLMVLITILAVGMLSLASVELRKISTGDARTIAMGNARLGLMLALGELQKDLGDDRRITADASIFNGTKNPNAVGVWTGWSPNLAARSQSPSPSRTDYRGPKQTLRQWLVSDPDPLNTRRLDYHNSESADRALLFSVKGSGFDLSAARVPVRSGSSATANGSMAWAVRQENTRAKVNIGVNDAARDYPEDQVQSPSRPNVALSSLLDQPDGGWTSRPATITTMGQLALDPAYGVTKDTVGAAARDFTVASYSLLTHAVNGGLKVDMTTGFEMSESEFATATWTDSKGSVPNPFRATTSREYKGQKPLFNPMQQNAQAQVFMNFHPASVNHKFQVNGVPTYDTLRSHYRIHRHLYQPSGGGLTAFERPQSHISTPGSVAGRPFGRKSQTSLAPVLDRMNLFFSIYAKSDGTLGILLTPVVTVWNPYNIEVETEGLVVYPWIDFAVFWNWRVTPAGGATPLTWSSSLSRFVGEGFEGHGRSSRPYFYLHLTQSGAPVNPGTKNISPPIRLLPGEVRVFTLADPARRDLEFLGSPQQRTWRMKPAASPSDITAAMKGGIVLNMTKSIGGTSNFNYKLQTGDRLDSASVGFDRGTYYYIVNMADAYQIRNPGVELMVEARSAGSGLPALPAEPNLHFYGQIHSGTAFGQGQDSLTYPSFRFEEIKETPKLVGSLLTYHRVAQSGTLPLSDLMFTTNPRQAYVNSYLSGAQFQTGPHYESVLKGGTSLAQLSMETTLTGEKAYYGPSHSAASGKSHLAFFEVPQTPTLSLGAFQHCDISSTAFTMASQIGNSWASPYLPSTNVSKLVTNAGGGEAINPGMAVYDWSYLANEVLFDQFYLSGAAPEFGQARSGSGSPSIWDADQISETKSVENVLLDFFKDPAANPLRNPRMVLYRGSVPESEFEDRISGPARSVRLAAHLMVDGGFNINSTSEEAWTAVLASLRGLDPARGDSTSFSRFRHVVESGPGAMAENDPWSGFRTLTDADLKDLAAKIVAEVKLRGPFLSLGEFVNRRVSTDRGLGLSGAIQAAIDKSSLNKRYSYSRLATDKYPNPENLQNPNTGTGTPGWLTQADLLHGLAPFITPRSDTFTIRSLGEAKDASGNILATVRLEAVVQRVPEWVDPSDDPEKPVAGLKKVNQDFGRRFQVVSIREIHPTEAS